MTDENQETKVDFMSWWPILVAFAVGIALGTVIRIDEKLLGGRLNAEEIINGWVHGAPDS
jgi:hypothetical protein